MNIGCARVSTGEQILVQRLLVQISRSLEINALRAIAREVVETAREGLVVGLLS